MATLGDIIKELQLAEKSRPTPRTQADQFNYHLQRAQILALTVIAEELRDLRAALTRPIKVVNIG